MPSNPNQPSQQISITVGNSAGSVQAVSAGQDAYATQQSINQDGSDAITPQQAIVLIEEIMRLIQSASLPLDAVDEVQSYTKLAKREAEKLTPNKQRIIGNLEGATSLVKQLSETTDAAKGLITQLKDPLIKLAGWLGVAAVHFL